MIEFPCVCGKLLGVGPELAGRRACCPGCGAVNTVPTDGPQPFPGAPPPGTFERPSWTGTASGTAAIVPLHRPSGAGAAAAAPSGGGTHPLVVAGFLLGLVGFFCFPAPVGLLLSVLGVRETTRHRDRWAGLGLGIAGIVINGFWLLLYLLLIFLSSSDAGPARVVTPAPVAPAPTSTAESAEAACTRNLGHLYTVLDIHRAEKRAYPPGTGARFLDHLERYGRDRLPKLGARTRPPLSPHGTRTAYRGPTRPLPADPSPGTPVVADWHDEHPGGIIHVLYVDGRVVTLRPGTPDYALALEGTQ